MNLTIRSTLLCSILVLLAKNSTLVAYGQVLNLSPSATDPTIQHAFFGSSGQDAQPFTFATPAIHLKNYNTIQVSVSAPNGYAWLVNADPSFSFQDIAFHLSFGNSYSSPATIDSVNLSFDFVQGGPGNLGSLFDNSLISNLGDRFTIDPFYFLSDDIAFTGFTATINFNNSGMSDQPLADFFSSYLSFNYGADSNPGQRLTLISVPEPASVSIAGVGLLALALSRRRRYSCSSRSFPNVSRTTPISR